MGNTRIRHSLAEFAKRKIHALYMKMRVRPSEVRGPLVVVNERAFIEPADMRGVAVCSEAEVVRNEDFKQSPRLQQVEAVPHSTHEVGDMFQNVISYDEFKMARGKRERFAYIAVNIGVPSSLCVYVEPAVPVIFPRT